MRVNWLKIVLLASMMLISVAARGQKKNETESAEPAEVGSALAVSGRKVEFEQFYDLVLFYLDTDGEGQDIDNEELENVLRSAFENPIDWNKATKQQLDELKILPDEVVEELLFYAYRYGPIRSLGELKLVNNLNYKLLDILPYLLKIDDESVQKPWKEAFKYTSHYLVARSDFEAERKAGFDNGKYLGQPFKQLVKYKTDAGDVFKAGVTLETDPGEPWKKRGFDLYRAYIQIDKLKVVERIVGGSMKVAFGNGLIFGDRKYGSQFSQMKTGLNQDEIRAYGGTQEYEIMTGAALKIKPVERLTIDLIYGCSLLDADTSKGNWKTIVTTGYHRTLLEQQKDNTVMLNTIGGHIQYAGEWFSVGATAFGGFFSVPAVASYDNGFQGDRQWAASLDYSFKKYWFRFSGETAVAQDKGVATTNTLTIRPKDDWTIVLNHRYINAKYHSYWAKTYSTASDVTGEHGASIGLRIPIYYNMCAEIFAGGYRDVRLKNKLQDKPFRHDLRVQYTATFKENHFLSVNFKFKQYQCAKEIDGQRFEKAVDEQTFQLSAAYRARLQYGFELQSGVTANATRNWNGEWSKTTFGTALFQDLDYRLERVGMLFRARLVLFDAQNWNNRIYLYEANISESSYSPVLYGKALRWYFIYKYAAKCGLGLQVKVGQTVYEGKESIGSGNDKIKGNHRTSFNLLVSYRFKQK